MEVFQDDNFDGGEVVAQKEVFPEPRDNQKTDLCCNLMVLIEFLLEYIALFDFVTDLIITV
jgi:hypothetical protein